MHNRRALVHKTDLHIMTRSTHIKHIERDLEPKFLVPFRICLPEPTLICRVRSLRPYFASTRRNLYCAIRYAVSLCISDTPRNQSRPFSISEFITKYLLLLYTTRNKHSDMFPIDYLPSDALTTLCLLSLTLLFLTT